MKENKKERDLKTAKVLANMSLQFGKVAANSACCYIYHQPKMPDSLKEMRNF